MRRNQLHGSIYQSRIIALVHRSLSALHYPQVALYWGMPRVAPTIHLDRMQLRQLQQLVKAPSTPQSLVLRGRIVLAAADRQSNQEIAARLSIPEITASKWRRRFARLGLAGLPDAPRAGRPLKHGPAVWEKVQRRACQQPEFQSRWSVRTLAREIGRASCRERV